VATVRKVGLSTFMSKPEMRCLVWPTGLYDQGERYYREGSRAVSNIDGTALAFALVVGAAGYALAYLIHGQQSWHEDRTRRRHGRERGGRNR
jgi:hypothetical protein